MHMHTRMHHACMCMWRMAHAWYTPSPRSLPLTPSLTHSHTHAPPDLSRPRSTRRHAYRPTLRHPALLACLVPCASRGKRTAHHLHPLTLRPRTCNVCTVCISRLYCLLSLLRDYLVKPLLGAIWKQPLRPHHALDLEPDWVARLAEGEEALTEAVRERMRLRYCYEAGPIPDVAAHCTNMIAELQQARA